MYTFRPVKCNVVINIESEIVPQVKTDSTSASRVKFFTITFSKTMFTTDEKKIINLQNVNPLKDREHLV